MGRMRIHLALRALTFIASAGALLGTLWLSQVKAEEGAVSPEKAKQIAEQVAEKATFDGSRVKLVVFAMTTCGHCKHFKKELATLAAAVPTMQIELVEYAPGQNDAKNRAAQARIGLAQVQGFPTTLVFIDGISTTKMPGYRPAVDVVSALSEQVLSYDRALQASM